MNSNFTIVPAHLAVGAMRDNGYKSLAYALAELIDNSIQAGATKVDVLLAERYEQLVERERRRIYSIGILDNGSGMNAETLRMALQFGNGTRLSHKQRTGMGRFGMGLPSASISQCRRVEVWSWQNGIDNALYTYLDLDEIEQRTMDQIPEPISRPIPKVWRDQIGEANASGTFITWSKIDRANWSTGKAIITNSEFVVGRMYRHFIIQNKVRIYMRNFVVVAKQSGEMEYYYDDAFRGEVMEDVVDANDPLYMFPVHILEQPWNSKPMFERFGDLYERDIVVNDIHGEPHTVKVRTTIASDEARDGDYAGSKPHGRHCAKNLGISIVRADRELDMDEGQVIRGEPKERWWGMEISFPPALDEIFGVTNNKQAAVKLREMLSNQPSSIKDNQEEFKDEFRPLYPIYEYVTSTLTKVRNALREQKTGQRTIGPAPESVKSVTDTITARENEGVVSGTQSIRTTHTPEQRKYEIQELLTQDGYTVEDAQKIADEMLKAGVKVTLDSRNLDSSSMFSIQNRGGILFLILNTLHPAYKFLFEISDTRSEHRMSTDERLRRTRTALEVLLFTWARMEDEAAGDSTKAMLLRRTREQWGEISESFFTSLNENN